MKDFFLAHMWDTPIRSNNENKKYLTLPGLEPRISCSVGRRLIHWAIEPDFVDFGCNYIWVSISEYKLVQKEENIIIPFSSIACLSVFFCQPPEAKLSPSFAFDCHLEFSNREIMERVNPEVLFRGEKYFMSFNWYRTCFNLFEMSPN